MRKWYKDVKNISEDCKVKICKKCKKKFIKDICGMGICEDCTKKIIVSKL